MTLKLNGSSSGYTAIDAPAAAGSNTLVLPTTNGSAGQVLKTDGNGNLSWTDPVDNTPSFVAYKTSRQDMDASSDTLIEMSTEGLDTDSAYDTSTSKFTVPSGKGGYYLIAVTLTIGEGNADYYKIILYKNGSDGGYKNGYTTDTSNTVGKFTTQRAVSLAAGDYIQLYG